MRTKMWKKNEGAAAGWWFVLRLGPASDPNLNAAATAICTQHKRPPTYIMEPQGWGWGSARSVRNLAGGPPKKDAARDRRSRAGGGPGGDSNPRPRGLQSVLLPFRPTGPKYSGHTKVTAKKKRHAKARRKNHPKKIHIFVRTEFGEPY